MTISAGEREIISECWELVDMGVCEWVGDPPPRLLPDPHDEFLAVLRETRVAPKPGVSLASFLGDASCPG